MNHTLPLRPKGCEHRPFDGCKATKAESIVGHLVPAAGRAVPIEPEDAEEDGEELTAVHEARVPQTLTSPDKPTEKECVNTTSRTCRTAAGAQCVSHPQAAEGSTGAARTR